MKISPSLIKRMVKSNSDFIMSKEAAEAIAKILEKKADTIAKYAVKRAKTQKRNIVKEDDIYTYRMKFGD